ncbi:MAG: 16S rRNA (cytosine(1402)-N(4))-methyltransferase RsmH [Bacteroidota bacterium]|nr:16S rRNA (cytosine(1402)-N(4))-methyltransferase RsmH [Bacteroidota bacterium]
MQSNYHNSVLLKESVDGLDIKPNGVYVDVTFGGGGHSREILKRLGANGRLIAFDQDEDALQNSIDDDRFLLINENFRFIKRFLRFHGIKKVDGVLADLGVSSHQFDKAERGFSIRFDAQLDMRMSKRNELSAYHIVNQYEKEQLSNLLYEYGELKNARSIAQTIVESRAEEPIKSSQELKDALSRYLPAHKSNKILAQIFQAFRIEVNQEIEVLKEFLLQMPEVIGVGGRLSVISYHSLEDRIVKRFIKNGMFSGEPERDLYGNYYTPFAHEGKVIVPTQAEIEQNNRARSAKLRIATRNEE